MAYSINETFQFEVKNMGDMIHEFNESTDTKKKTHGLVIEVAAIHVGATKNANYYSEDALHEAVHTWTSPFQKPIIKNHDLMTEPLGRVIGASVESSDEGIPYIKIQAAITDPVAIERVLDGRYLTGSIGATAQEAVCSACGTDWAKESGAGLPCRHRFGAVHEGKQIVRALRGLNFHEYSFVNAPSDQNSVVKSIKTEERFNRFDFQPRVFELGLETAEIKEYDIESSTKSIVEASKPTFLQLKGAFIAATEYKQVAFTEGDTTNTKELTDIGEHNMSKTDETTTDLVEEKDDDILDLIEADEAANADNKEEETSEEATDTEEAKGDEEQPQETETPAEGDEATVDSENEVKSEEDAETSEGKKDDEEEAKADDEKSEDEVDGNKVLADADAEDEEKPAVPDDDQAKDKIVTPDDKKTESDETVDAQLAEEDSVEPKIAELEEKIQALEDRNERLTKALHKSIVERVVDAKIARGFVNEDARVEAVEEHSTRKASSLMDNLKDLRGMPSIQTFELRGDFKPTAGAVEEKGTETEVDEDIVAEESAPKKSPREILEDKFADILLGKTPLH